MVKFALSALVALGGCLASAEDFTTPHKPPLVSRAGQKVAIPNWDITTSSNVTKDTKSLSLPGVKTNKWIHIPTSRCTLMGCLLNAGLYKDSDLWFSDNLNRFNWGQFTVPWLYRNEFALDPAKGKHYILQTNGIGSKADLFLNGKKIADKAFQSGGYGGHAYDITNLAQKDNAFVVQVYPTDYMYDFALGFVDWNPYPADNGTGVWRNITIKQTGAVSLGSVGVSVDIDGPIQSSPASVTIRAKAQNLEDRSIEVLADAVITGNSPADVTLAKQTVKLGPHETKVVLIKATIKTPKIWWPKQWGEQPLYKAKLTLSVNNQLSDTAETNFGVRKVSSQLNKHNDTQFYVNGYPFHVVGGGYSADMFLRWDADRFTKLAHYMLDMNQNTIRLEGKMEHPELYDICDEAGLMVLAGWECCDKWEAWEYNHELSIDPPPVWDENDYQTANASMIHEAEMIQPHPSALGFLIGSDFWPNDRATAMYVNALKDAGWQIPIIPSASKRGHPKQLGPSGMKMDGPYDYVPPNYWWDVDPSSDRLGAAFGFGSELGAGVGTPEVDGLKKFLTPKEMEDLWTKPDKGHFHMSTNVSSFYTRSIYNKALFNRFGAPKSLDDYILKAQLMDYETIKAQYEAYGAHMNADRPATGLIYWMVNNAWPSLHWNQLDHYFSPAAAYYGTKVGSRIEHISYNYVKKEIWVHNRSLKEQGLRNVTIDFIDINGKSLGSRAMNITTKPLTTFKISDVSDIVSKISDVGFLRLILGNPFTNQTYSRNTYYLTKEVDKLDWDNSTWYHTPITKFVDFNALNRVKPAKVNAKLMHHPPPGPLPPNTRAKGFILENLSDVPAVFLRLNVLTLYGREAMDSYLFDDAYFTLWPKERLELREIRWEGPRALIRGSGLNAAFALAE